ncbi:MAG TPA: 2Fe-2S iron-sulfur cluster-binding protein, partial [Edaphobacter sp.]|nr:2Fe-2S iron-sulfur cluster-binding protein [Edaphobacter sp.]
TTDTASPLMTTVHHSRNPFNRCGCSDGYDNPKVRQEVRFWLDKGVDGFRMDVIPIISKQPGMPDLTPEQLKNEQVPQCGYCQPGQIMSAATLLAQKPHPATPISTRPWPANLCRCGSSSS